MSKRIAVRVLHEAFINGRYRKPGEIFLVDRDLFEREQLPSCVQHVAAEQPAKRDAFVEATP